MWRGTFAQYGLRDFLLHNDGESGILKGHAINGVEIPTILMQTEGKKECFMCVPPGHEDIERILEETFNFRQDPDVLDTWFSSALWPHSTLGWPDRTPDLAKWYPTSVLLTGRDIITLWVARMVMTGMYNMGHRPPLTPSLSTLGEGGGEGQTAGNAQTAPHPLVPKLSEDRERGKELGIPFFHVAINPTILDGHGERMSKSKGNGVDPVDVIETHGADALRFTLTHMATETQDVRMPVKRDAQGRNTSDKFDLGSRFCNKIWQVANFFVIPNLEKIPPENPDPTKWTLADRWIVSRFNRAVQESNAALEIYRFDQYAKICYDFFYGDFCDWYVEAAKPALKDPAAAGQTSNILATILDGSLRLMHPMIPFITEVIWSPPERNPPRPRLQTRHRLILRPLAQTRPNRPGIPRTFRSSPGNHLHHPRNEKRPTDRRQKERRRRDRPRERIRLPLPRRDASDRKLSRLRNQTPLGTKEIEHRSDIHSSRPLRHLHEVHD